MTEKQSKLGQGGPAVINYQKELEKILARLRPEENRPRLLLHCCCAPCSSYVLEYLSRYFSITTDFYNPNISPRQEHDLSLIHI